MVRFVIATVLFSCFFASSYGQSCTYHVHGVVRDAKHQPVPGAVVHLIDDSLGDVSDTSGFFAIEHVCLGKHTLVCEAIGYGKVTLNINVDKDKNIPITLAEQNNELQMVTITGSREQEDLHTVAAVELKGLTLLQTRGTSLGESLKELPGLNAVESGPTLSKPIIHGLHSNRVLIINDGVRQEGQQWGDDHAPELDPFVANNISAIKGAASVRYGSDALGGVILLTPDPLPTDKGINSDVYLVGSSNGRSGALSGMLQGAFDKGLKGLSWRVQGTLKDAGNFKTPNYYLYNSGAREGDFSATLGYKWKRLTLGAFYSEYNTKIGIFTGAESDNVQDLLNKFSLAKPLTPDYFSYNIGRGYQHVQHNMLKLNAGYDLSNGDKLELTFARQVDNRKEYEQDVPYSTNPAVLAMPDDGFLLTTHTLDLIYTQMIRHGFSGSFGITSKTSGNVLTGLEYLIPNYRDYNSGIFAIERYTLGKFDLEGGIRYDYRWMRAYHRDENTDQQYNTTNTYQNVTGTIGATYHYNDHLSVTANAGTAWRAPGINELFINGVHASDPRYEQGDSTLQSERALNTGLTFNYKIDKFRATVDLYYNHIFNFIYENPCDSFITNSSGTFPAYAFKQNTVNIKGLDLSLQYDFLPRFTFESKTTIVRGYNKTIHDYLINMPADRFENGIEYHLTNWGKVKAPYISLDNVSVLTQTRTIPAIEFVQPPKGYTIFNLNAGCTLPVKQHTLDVNFSVDNLTNVAYRDYLDHFRYYNDELGINFILRLKYSF